MKNALVTLITILFFQFISTAGEGNLYEVDMQEKINESSLVVYGEVIHQASYWTANNESIYTENTVKIFQKYKGTVQSDLIIVRTIGGVVGTTELTTSALLELEVGHSGIFFCVPGVTGNFYDVYSSKQGFIRYSNDLTKAVCPFYESSVAALEIDLINKIGVPVTLNPVPTYSSGPHIPSSNSPFDFYPDVITAGTGHVLTLVGSGFGSGPDLNNYVEMEDADYAGNPNFDAVPLSNYLTWNDTMIRFVVQSKAGTGVVRLTVAGTMFESTDTLFIPYAIRNTANNNMAGLTDLNGANGHTWIPHQIFSSGPTPPIIALTAAMDTWKCATGINWDMSATTTLDDGTTNDGVNLLTWGPVPAGVLGVTYTYIDVCPNGDYAVVDQDIVFNYVSNFNYSTFMPLPSEYDFQTVALHELGHAHLLAHVIDSDNTMHYGLGTGEMRRDLDPYNIMAGLYVMDYSNDPANCQWPNLISNFPVGCSIGIKTDIGLNAIDTPPLDSLCFGTTPVLLDFGNYGVEDATEIQWNWTVNGVPQTSATWTGSLAMNDTVNDFVLGNYNFQDSLYEIVVWVESVNSGVELNLGNDTVTINFHPISCSPDNATVAITTTFDPMVCYNNEPVVVDLINDGVNDLTSCWLYLATNGTILDSVLWTGLLAPDDTVSVVVGNNTDFALGTNTLNVWVFEPNGVADTYPVNDTATYLFDFYRLNGTYTIGGVSPDFNTVMDAFNTLDNFGVCGDVIFNIRDGVYTGLHFIDSIPAENLDYLVTFQSESGNAQGVIIENGSTSFTAVKMEYVYNVHFKNVTFTSDGTNSTPIVELKYRGSNYEFEGCQWVTDPSGQSDLLKVYSWVDSLTIVNCDFINGRVGVYLSGNTDDFANGIVIQNNRFIGQDIRVIDIRNFTDIEVSGNMIENYSSSSTDGIYILFRYGKCDVFNNRVHKSSGGYASYIQSMGYSPKDTVPVRYFNNEVSMRSASGSNSNPVRLVNFSILDFHHNSILVSNDLGDLGTGSYPATIVGIDTLRMFNNQLINYQGGYTVSISNVTDMTSDYNNYWTTGNMSYGPSSINATLQAHISAFQTDQNSLFIFPNFISYDSLVPMNTDSLDNKGVFLPEITEDIANNQRDLITPDIGAYEFHQMEYDLQVNSLNVSDSVICTGSALEVIFDVYNNGTQTVDSFLVCFSMDGGLYDTISVVQTIAPESTVSVSIGSYPLSDLQNAVVLYTALPNGVTDSIPINNMISGSPGYKLSGTYTVGGVTPDFATINDALQQLNDFGVCGPVVMYLRDGYHEDWDVLYEFPGISAQNNVVFTSDPLNSANALVRTNSSLYALRFAGAKFLTFNHLDIVDVSTEDIVFDESYKVTFDSCNFMNIRLQDLGLQRNRRVRINECDFSNSYITFDNLGSNAYMDSLEVINCQFNGINGIKLYTSGTPYITNGLIKGNTMNTTNLGLWMRFCQNMIVEGNNISSNDKALELEYCYGPDFMIRNNFVRNNFSFKVSNSNGVQFINNSYYGMPFEMINGNSNLTLRNNIFSNPGSNALYVFSSQLASMDIDFSLFYGSSSQTIRVNSTYMSVAAWQSTYGLDQNSLYGDPLFASSSDLHISNSLAVNNGVVWPGVIDDIDGENRDSMPDIGADEFVIDTATVFDVALTNALSPVDDCIVTDSIIVELTNNFTTTLTNATLTWSVDGGTVSSSSWSGSLGAGLSESVFVGTYPFVGGNSYTIEITVTDPNGQNDYLNNDNTFTFTYSPAEQMTINAPQTEFCPGDDIQLFANLAGFTLVWSTGETTPDIWVSTPGQYWLQGTDASGCISSDTVNVNYYPLPVSTFTVINDTLLQATTSGATGYQWVFNGQPITGATASTYNAHQTGTYSLISYNSYGCEDFSDPIFLDFTSLNEWDKTITLTVRPNPFGSYVELSFDYPSSVDVKLYDISGKLVLDRKGVLSGDKLDTEVLSSGVYMLHVNGLHSMSPIRILKM